MVVAMASVGLGSRSDVWPAIMHRVGRQVKSGRAKGCHVCRGRERERECVDRSRRMTGAMSEDVLWCACVGDARGCVRG